MDLESRQSRCYCPFVWLDGPLLSHCHVWVFLLWRVSGPNYDAVTARDASLFDISALV